MMSNRMLWIAAAGFIVAPFLALVALAVWPPAGPTAAALLRETRAGAASPAGAPFDHEHTAWTEILRRYVQDGSVDYAGLKHGGERALSDYLLALDSVRRDQYDRWTRDQKLAFWINSYNAHTIRLILDHYPVESIRSIGLTPLAAFRKRFISMPGFSRKRMSLNGVENGILRGQFAEPRIHFAIVCASRSCPRLRSEAYTASRLEEQLEEAAREFLRDPAKNRFDSASRTLRLSPIFEWFRGDFEHAAGTVPKFVARYVDEPAASAAGKGDVRLDFLSYDWSLNGR